MTKVQVSCEKVQRYGQLRDEEAQIDLSPVDALDKIRSLVDQVKEEYKASETWLKDWYAEHGVTLKEP